MATAWFYADRHRQQQGPVDATWFADALRRGDVTPASLVWREGLAGWVALAQVAAELGVAPRAASPPPYAAAPHPARASTLREPNDRPVRIAKSSGVSGWVIVVIILIAAVPVLGILAAIAIPAYSDYTTRARVTQGLNAATALKAEVTAFYLTEQRCPKNGDSGIGAPESYATIGVATIAVGPLPGGNCGIDIAHADLGRAELYGAITRMSLRDGTWQVSSTVPERYLPARLRGELVPFEGPEGKPIKAD